MKNELRHRQHKLQQRRNGLQIQDSIYRFVKKILACFPFVLIIQPIAGQSLLQYVQPLSGTAASSTTAATKHSEAGSEKNANTIPAVALPFAMTQWTPQTRTTEVKCQPPYYYKDSLLSGFRGTHWLSGSCTQDYGSFTIMPVTGHLKTSVDEYAIPFSRSNEIATAAYYQLETQNITTEITSTLRCGIMRFATLKDDSLYLLVTSNSDNRGVGIQSRDEGVVSDVIFSNMIIEGRLFSDVWWGKAEPIYITAYRRAKINHKDANWRFPKGATEGRVGEVKNIFFSNIKCTSENGIYVSAESADKISNIIFDEVDVFINKTTTIPGGVYDRRPAQAEGFVKGSTSGFYFDKANAIRVRNSSVVWGTNRPAYFAYALESYGVSSLRITGLEGNAAFPSKLRNKISN